MFEKGQLAAALQQWQILQLGYPDNDEIAHKIALLRQSIAKQKSDLIDQLSQLANHQNSQARQIKLKILALDPNDADIKAQLSSLVWQQELDNAKKKTSAIAQVYRQKKQKARKNEKLQNILENASIMQQNQDFDALLSQIEKLKNLSPTHPKIASYSFAAHLGLAENYLQSSQYLDAIQAFNLAIAFAEDEAEKTRIETKIQNIKNEQANHYYLAALRVFKQDIEQAIEYLRQSLKFDQDNPKTVQQLKIALKIQENLSRINEG
ncbi:hypothetical protein [Glaciecola sp. 1036]|uniref:hypothetical protein n=1 Tax=Alteromonadaceae TaxID=72275 RepID=UPI003D07F691